MRIVAAIFITLMTAIISAELDISWTFHNESTTTKPTTPFLKQPRVIRKLERPENWQSYKEVLIYKEVLDKMRKKHFFLQ